MTTVTLRYWAAAKQAAGVAEETINAETLAAALAEALSVRERDPAFAGVDALRGLLACSSFLVDGTPVGGRAAESVVLPDAAVVEVLPPFAGG
jgi:molybdopterin converting factor small subunit